MKLKSDHLRVLENTAVAYDTWMSARREREHLGPRLSWRNLEGVDHLYAQYGRSGAKSLGKRGSETERLKTIDDEARTRLEQTILGTTDRLVDMGREYRAHRLPRLHPMVGKIAREADLRGMMGTALLVVGTNAMPVYEIEAQFRFASGLDSTEDCDFAWCMKTEVTARMGGTLNMPFYSLMKAVDSSFVVNQEMPYQLLNSSGYAVELLLGKSLASIYPKAEAVRPIPFMEQDWLLQGRPVEHVLFDTDNQPMRLVVPDPRWMALHKLWLSEKPERNPMKKPKDAEQGRRLLKAVLDHMPAFRMDDAFKAELPEELKPVLEKYFSKASSP